MPIFLGIQRGIFIGLTHYHSVILNAIPGSSARALDVGCGDGTLARQLRRLVPQITAIDLARHHDDGADIEYVLGDFLSYPFEPASFDVIVSVAALHHMDATAALGRMRDLLRAGGTLAIVGLARSEFPADLPFDLAGVVATRFHRLTKTFWEHSSPTVWPAPETFAETRILVARVLPGARYRRHLLWRYSLTWNKPPP